MVNCAIMYESKLNLKNLGNLQTYSILIWKADISKSFCYKNT